MDARLLITLPLRAAFLLACLAFPHNVAAQSGPVAQWQSSQWYRGGATLDLDFVHDQYWLNGTSYSGVANFVTGAGATFTRAGTTNVTSTVAPFYTNSTQAFVSRASSATYFDNAGTLQTASTNTARNATYTYNGSTWVANSGTLVEPASTNYVPYSTFSGATAASATQLVTNGSFGSCSGSTCTSWTTTVNGGTGSVGFSSNVSLTGDGTHAAAAYQTITIAANTWYQLSVTVAAGNSANVRVGTSAGGSQITIVNNSQPGAAAAGTTTVFELEPGAATTIYVQVEETSAVTATVTNVSLTSLDLPAGEIGALAAACRQDFSSPSLIPALNTA